MRVHSVGALFVGLIGCAVSAAGQTNPPPFIFEIRTHARFGPPKGSVDQHSTYLHSDGFGASQTRGQTISELSYNGTSFFNHNVATVFWEPGRISTEVRLVYFVQPGAPIWWDDTEAITDIDVWARGPRDTPVRIDYEYDNSLAVSGCNPYRSDEQEWCNGSANSHLEGTNIVIALGGRYFPEFPGVEYGYVERAACPSIFNSRIHSNVGRYRNVCGSTASFATYSRIKSINYELLGGYPPLPILNGPFYALVGRSATWVSNSYDQDDALPAGNGIIEAAWDHGDEFVSTGPSLTLTFAESDLGQNEIFLEVTDNEGAEATTAQLVRVIRLEDIFVDCFFGPSPPNPPYDPTGPCALYDSDGDGDIDLVDLAAMEVHLSGY